MDKPAIKILVCIPSFDTKIHLETISAIISSRDILIQHGIGIGMMWVRDSLVSRARNKLVTQFLKSDSTHLFFIDADISFMPDDFIRVVSFDKDVVSAPYPIKKETPIEKGDASQGWCLNFPLGKYDFTDNENGFKQCDYAGTGFMLIKRKVFDIIKEKYPSIAFKSDVVAKIDDTMENHKGNTEYAFFDCGIQGQGILQDKDKTQRYLSEDYYFCQLWKQCGGEIWTDLTSQLKHIGLKTYKRKSLMERKPKNGK
tara:strand:+ start:591 stop:1358 length:768 start_codon:yes stop_codon:yes gene_type:complete